MATNAAKAVTVGRDSETFMGAPELNENGEEDDGALQQQHQQQATPQPSLAQHVKSPAPAELDLCSSARSKRPHVPYSQREIYEKKPVTTPTSRARPPTGQACNRRSSTGSAAADSGSTPVATRQQAASPSYSRNRTSPSVSATPGTTAAGRSSSVSRQTATTPMRGVTGSTPRGAASATPRDGTGDSSARTPAASSGGPLRQVRDTTPSLSRPPVDWQPKHQQLNLTAPPAARMPMSARCYGQGVPATPQAAAGMRAPSPGPGRAFAASPATARDATPTSARLASRAQSASRSQRTSQPTPPQSQAKPSPAKASSVPHGMTSSPQPSGGKALGSPTKPVTALAQLERSWDPSTSKTAITPTNRPAASSSTAGRPPRKTLGASGGGGIAATAAAPVSKSSASPAAAMAAAAAAAAARGLISGVDQGINGGGAKAPAAVKSAYGAGVYTQKPSLSPSSAVNDCAAQRDDAEPAGQARDGAKAAGGVAIAAGPATDGGASEMAESLGLIDLDGSDSISLCGSRVPHAGVPAKGALLVPAPSCADGSEPGSTPAATGWDKELGVAEAEAVVGEAEAGTELAARPCGCVVM